MMRGIAQTLAKVGAPDALLLQLTNPQMYCRIENGEVIRLIIPVVEAVIETDFQAVLAGGGDRFRHQIAPGGPAVAAV
ncbi:MAG: hypothetical protein WCQ57_09925 [Verrucomicrobiota bacterium]